MKRLLNLLAGCGIAALFVVMLLALAGCSAIKSITDATKDKAVALGSDTWGGGGEVTMADPEKPVPNAEFWFGRRKVWYVSGKDAEAIKAAAEVVKASNSPISAGVGATGISMEQSPPAKSE